MKLLLLLLVLHYHFFLGNTIQDNKKICQTTMTKKAMINDLFSNDCLLQTNAEVLGFKIKVPKFPTETIAGNVLTKEAVQNIYQCKSKHPIIIFDIVYDLESEDLPGIISIRFKK